MNLLTFLQDGGVHVEDFICSFAVLWTVTLEIFGDDGRSSRPSKSRSGLTTIPHMGSGLCKPTLALG